MVDQVGCKIPVHTSGVKALNKHKYKFKEFKEGSDEKV